MKRITFLLTLSTPLLHAQWALVDDMETDNNWIGTGLFGPDPDDAANQVFIVENTGIRVQNHLPLATPIPEGTTATLFFRMRSSANEGLVDWVVGMSDVSEPTNWPDFEGYLRLAEDGSAGDIDIDARDGGGFTEVGGADSDIWINLWLVLDNTADLTDVYFNTSPVDATTAGTASFQGGTFRNGTADDLITLLTFNNEANTISYLDDVFLDLSGENLTHPLARDDDNDGISDLWEETFFGDTSRDGTLDFDNDNLTDLAEFQENTNPTLQDSDGDTINDDIELAGSANPFDNAPTNPRVADSDHDGFDDAEEGAASSDPNDSLSVPTQATGFQLIEDFEGEGMTIGESFNGVNGWTAIVPEAISVTTEENSTDQVGRLERTEEMTTSNAISKSLDDLGLQVLDGTTGTLFFQVLANSGNVDQSFGLSDVVSPNTFGNFEAQLVVFRDNILRGRDAGGFRDQATYAIDTWMNVWIVANNESDTVKIYVESPDGETGQIEITDDGGLDRFDFRNGTTDPLFNILFITARGADPLSTVLVDNIYLDPTSENLTSPAPSKGTPAGITITGTSFDENGNLVITFTPGGEGYFLSGSSDLASPFEEEVDAVYDDVNTFTVDADDLFDDRRFYRVERR